MEKTDKDTSTSSSSNINQEEEHHQQQQQVWSWGAGTDGQLGTGRLEDEHSPQFIRLPLPSLTMLACGGAHVLALTSGGKVYSWGRGSSGQLGHGENVNSLYPKILNFPDGHPIKHVSAGWNHSGFVSDSGFLYTCGDGSFGQLGHGDYRSHCSPVRVSYFDNMNVQQIACGMRHSLALLKDTLSNQVYGFGSGKRGQLGISNDKIKSVSLPQITNGFEDVEIVGISANGDHSAALSSEGHLYTWGKGFNSASQSHSPQRLSSSLQFTQAAVGWNHALLLTGNGDVHMIGGSLHGALSGPVKTVPTKHFVNPEDVSVVEKVAGLDGVKVVQISAGAEHSALLTEARQVMTWGWGEHGQLGLGDTLDQTNPQAVRLNGRVPNEDSLFAVYCGSGFTYAIRTKPGLKQIESR